MAEPLRIAVCALTYQRPGGLDRLLAGLASLRYVESRPDVTVVIVDNNPDGTARPICEGWGGRPGMRILYVHEPRPGIPAARNRALEAVDPRTEWIAFIDDDEVPEPDWLDHLVRAQREHEADVVTGPVDRLFEVPPPAWVRRGRFFERAGGLGPMPGRRTGVVLPEAATNNVMFRASILGTLSLRFDERYAFGEDTAFFRRIAGAGCKIVWVEEARVVEWMPAKRASGRWLAQRRYRFGVVTAMLARDAMPDRPGSKVRSLYVPSAKLAATVARKAVVGGLVLAVTPLVPRHVAVRARGKLAFGLGFLETVLEDNGDGSAAGRRARAGEPPLPSSLVRRSLGCLAAVIRRIVWRESRQSGEEPEIEHTVG